MGFWSRLWDTPDAIAEGARAVIKSGDALVYTEEEKAEFGQRVRDWLLKWQQATSGQNIARRLIALMVTGVWLLESVAALALTIWSAFSPDSEAVSNAAMACWDAARSMALPAGVILTFYFAPNKIGEAMQKYQQARGTQTDSIRGS